MATLSAMFRLYDRYSSTVKKIIDQTDRAAAAILGASRKTDGYNESLKRTAAAANVASSGLGRLIGTVASLAAVKKGMDMTDTYTNTNARLAMITGSLEEQRALQADIFASADRARGSYNEMANAAAKLKMLAGDSFGSNQEAIGFAELLTKSLKVSGAGQAEQNSAFLQLTQAMTSGKLQGDEFRSVMENAPMVADAIARYMGKSKAELKELSKDGAITADIIKGAMFSAADDINGKFAQMPMTFADAWQKIKNAGTQAFGGVFQKINDVLNSAGVQSALNNFIGMIYFAGDAMENFIDFCVAAWPMISPFIWAAAAAVGAYVAAQAIANGLSLISSVRFGAQAVGVGLYALALWATTGATWAETTAQLGLNSALYACPIVWIVGAVLLLVAAFYAGVAAVNHFAGTSISATGLIVGALFAAGAFIGNLFISIYNLFVGIIVDIMNRGISFAEFFANFLNEPVLAVMRLIADLANYVLGVLGSLAKAIDTVFGTNLSGIVSGWSASVDGFKNSLTTDSTITYDRIDKSSVYMNRLNYGDSFDKGYGIGESFGGKISNYLNGFNPGVEGSGIDFSSFATGGNPATVKGTGKGGAVKVENEEDLEWMRKLAERDYVARISQNTLAPNIRVEFSGPITKEADTDGVMSHVVDQLKDIISTSPEGVPT